MTTFSITTDAQLRAALVKDRPGDTITLAKGVYKPFTVTTSDVDFLFAKGAVVDASGTNGSAMTILADDVHVTGGEFRNAVRSGITVQGADGVEIEGVYSHHNARYGVYGGAVDWFTVEDGEFSFNGRDGGAGISIRPESAGGAAAGYRIRITGNDVHHNEQTRFGNTEGWGIIYDNNPERVYKHATLISGNTITHNGNSGLLLFNAEKAFVRENLIGCNASSPLLADISRAEVKVRDSDIYAAHNTIVSESDATVSMTGLERGHVGSWAANTFAVLDTPKAGGWVSFGAYHELPGAGSNHIGVQAHEINWIL